VNFWRGFVTGLSKMGAVIFCLITLEPSRIKAEWQRLDKLLLEHAHSWHEIIAFDHAPIPPGPPYHTAFMILGCSRCGATEAYPLENYKLTTTDFKQMLATVLQQKGWQPPCP
jgi:hypothetical protein